jgi:flavin-dependent dehydrogenase
MNTTQHIQPQPSSARPGMPAGTPHRVVIVGGGFAGLEAARKLARRAMPSETARSQLLDAHRFVRRGPVSAEGWR